MRLKFEEIQKKDETRREEVKNKLDTLKAKIGEEKDAAKAKIKEARVMGREQALERFDVALARMTGLKDKINTVIDKLSAKGVATTTAEGLTATAETKLGVITDKVAQIDALLTGSIDQLTPEDKTKLRTLAQETQTLIKEVHATLIDAIKSLKDEVKAKIEKEQEDKTKTEDSTTNTDNTTTNDNQNEDNTNQ